MKTVFTKIIYFKHIISCVSIVTISSIMLLCESCGGNSKKQSQYSDNSIKQVIPSKPVNIQEEYIIQDSIMEYGVFSSLQKELPIEIKGCEYEEGSSPEEKHYHRNGTEYIAYCRFNINHDVYALISLGLADCYIPIISTYIKDSLIDEKEVNIGFGDIYSGETTGDYLRIDQNHDIYVSDTVTEYTCETLDTTNKKRIKYVLYKVGNISSDGRITISNIIRKIIG